MAISAPNAMENCDHPSEFGAAQKCFAAQFPCPYFYLGFEGAPDFSKALEVCKTADHDVILAIMYLNGEGTARDLDKSEAVLSAWKKRGEYEFNPDQAAIIQKAIDRCRDNGEKGCPRLDYCKDLAEATLDLEICDAAQQLSSESSFTQSLARVKSSLGAGEVAEFDQVVTDFKLYQDGEAGRAYDTLGNGTTRGLAGNAQAAFVRENFSKLIHETIIERKLQPVTAVSYEQIAHEADQEYRRDLVRVLSFQRGELKNQTRKSRWAQDRSQLRNTKKPRRIHKRNGSGSVIHARNSRVRSIAIRPAVSIPR